MGALPSSFHKSISAHLHDGTCPSSGCIGECPAIEFQSKCHDGTERWTAYLSIWDDAFNDPSRVAGWFHEAGAQEVRVLHVLHDELNADRNGREDEFGGARNWQVDFYIPVRPRLTSSETH